MAEHRLHGINIVTLRGFTSDPHANQMFAGSNSVVEPMTLSAVRRTIGLTSLRNSLALFYVPRLESGAASRTYAARFSNVLVQEPTAPMNFAHSHKSGRTCQFEFLEQRQMLTVAAEFLADIRPGGVGSKIGLEWVQYQDEVYFTAEDGSSGRELWKSDGTEVGTQRVKDIFAGSNGSSPSFITPFQGDLYFAAADASGGSELWKTDGSENGTRRIADIQSGDDSSRPRDLVVFEDRLYFSADNGVDGAELWTSSGTSAGTRQVADIYPGDRNSDPGADQPFVEFDGLLYFSADAPDVGGELFRTDGDTVELAFDADNGSQDSLPTSLTIFGGDLYFVAEVLQGNDFQAFLYRVDAATHNISQFFPHPVDLREGLTIAGDRMYFAGGNDQTGIELYQTDGTSAGTQLVRDVFPGEDSSRPQNFLVVGDELYFSAGDSFEPESSRVVHQLWITGGTAATTRKVSDENIDQNTPFVAYDNHLFYLAQDESLGWEMHRTDGTTAGTQIVEDINPGSGDSFGIPKLVFENQLLFLANNGTNGFEIWTWDGNEAAMSEVHLGGGDFTDDPDTFAFGRLGPNLVFRGSTPFEGDELFIIRSSGPATLEGDADGNGAVEFADFLIVSANFGSDDADRIQGDLDGNRTVDFADFLILSANFGRTLS